MINKLVEHIKPAMVDGRADLWTLSPPCQPHTTTRGAHQKDDMDKRSMGFQHMIHLLSSCEDPPRHILLENVKGFVGSNALCAWKTALRLKGYTWRQYLLSPVHVGIPNNRTRYYMIAERSSRFLADMGEGRSDHSTKGREVKTDLLAVLQGSRE